MLPLHRLWPAAMLLLAGCSSAGSSPTPARPSPTVHSSSPSPSASPSAASSIRDFIPAAERFVEQTRHLKFKHPVDITFLNDADFQKKLLDQPQQANAAQLLQTATKELRAFSLVPASFDLKKSQDALLSAAVVGFYVPHDKKLYVRGTEATPYDRETLVHELTHAAQDQNFNIDRPDLDNDTIDERGTAWHALLEGDAVRVQRAYRASLSPDEQRSAGDADAAGAARIPKDIPQALLLSLGFPYFAGSTFISALLTAYGEDGIDRAFATPPTTTAELLHPARYFARQTAVAVAPPPADGPVFDHGTLGAEGLLLILSQAGTVDHLAVGSVQTATEAWNGDSYVAWDAGKHACVRDRMVADTAAHANALADSLQLYADAHTGILITRGNPLVITACA
jgi:hypothetical protein